MSCALRLRSLATDQAARAFARHIGCGQGFGRDGSFEGLGGSGHHHGKAWKSSEDMDDMDMDDMGESRHGLLEEDTVRGYSMYQNVQKVSHWEMHWKDWIGHM